MSVSIIVQITSSSTAHTQNCTWGRGTGKA